MLSVRNVVKIIFSSGRLRESIFRSFSGLPSLFLLTTDRRWEPGKARFLSHPPRRWGSRCSACSSSRIAVEACQWTTAHHYPLTDKKNVLQIVSKHPGISRINIIPITGKSEATVKRDLKALGDMGFVEYRGSNKTGGYFSLWSLWLTIGNF